MITVEAAIQLIEQHCLSAKAESVSLSKSRQRILAQDIIADRPMPPYDRVTMDGIAISYSAYEAGQRQFKIESIAAAGSPQRSLEDNDSCIEVMTGAILPIGVDTVIRYEDLLIAEGSATLIDVKVRPQQNVHHQGSDRAAGSTLLAAGLVIGAPELGILASVGKAEVLVRQLPRTAIISTGDELVEVADTPAPHQIRRSNNYSLAAWLTKYGIDAQSFHLRDDLDHITETITKLLETHQLLIISGGVSKGKYDHIPTALKSAGVTAVFHSVLQRPGKPLWFGSNGQSVVFGLPGNPVSSFVCCSKYVSHWLDQSIGKKSLPETYAILDSDYPFSPDLHRYLPVLTYTKADGRLMATPYAGNGSGDLSNLASINAIMELPRGKDLYTAGETYPYYTIR